MSRVDLGPKIETRETGAISSILVVIGLGKSCVSGCASCCHDVRIPLSFKEAETMQRGGSVLSEVVDDYTGERPLQIRGREIFRLVGRCGYLNSDNACSIHEDPSRPKACKKFRPGSSGCKEMRRSDAS